MGALALVGGAVLCWQNGTMTSLRSEVERLRGREAEWTKLQAEQKRLAALQVPTVELESLRVDRAAVERLRAEINNLRARLEKTSKPPTQENTAPDRLSVGKVVPAAEWRNVGANTPPAALETALWAAAGGDVEAFAALLMFEGTARKAAQTLLDSLPADGRAQHGTPERLIAFLTIKDVPLGSAEVRRWSDAAEGQVMLARLMLSVPGGTPKDVTLPLARQDQTWKLMVVETTVAKYAAMLKGPPATVGGK